MSESGIPLGPVGLDVDKAEAILDKVEQVLQVLSTVRAAPKGDRVLFNTGAILIVGGAVLVGVSVLIARRATPSSTPTTAT